jgi:hypothetical protein
MSKSISSYLYVVSYILLKTPKKSNNTIGKIPTIYVISKQTKKEEDKIKLSRVNDMSHEGRKNINFGVGWM